MDGLKLNSWRKKFTEQATSIRMEYDAFFLNKKLEDYYSLFIDETSEELELRITDELPEEIKDRLLKLLITTKPEDSI
ncbi:MAG: hypothetical protein DI539_26905 [Flavobacterium psychrophilum]|jgi:hypothetical protein|nr:hypothetical protein [Bacteroidota bacterium]MCH5688848.1 hypothetical protein [Niabella sp. W65]MCH7367350.1 hypothetical protein [Niabella sp. W65]PZR03039.1 MAG: hypothetical protein DI539_26905 [Flavobacterium psychrophilum]ULT43010.1 hypothetical protein KRR40_05605 [Niabella sp. I65]